MKLFAYAFAAASSSGVAMVLLTEEDFWIEINRMNVLGKSSCARRSRHFLQTCALYDRHEQHGEVYMCISENYTGAKHIRYNHLSADMLQRLGGNREV